MELIITRNKMKVKQNRYLRGFLWVVTGVSAVLVLGALLSAAGLLPTNIWTGADRFLTKMTEIFGFAAVFLIVFRQLWSWTKNVNFPLGRWLLQAWKFLRARHVLFGWIVAAAGTAHSIYFLIFIPGDFNGVISGLAAFAIMIAMVGFGYLMDRKASKSKAVRVAHTVLSIIFMAALLYHLNDIHV